MEMSEEFKAMVEGLIEDPNDPRTKYDQFLNGYTEYGMVDSEKDTRIEEIIARCDAGVCSPSDLAHKVDCPVARGSGTL